MKIDKKEVLRVAGLAHLKIADDEMENYTNKFNQILAFIDQLNQLDTSKVPPTQGGISMPTPMRTDELRPSLSVDEALQNAPERFADFLLVPKVVES